MERIDLNKPVYNQNILVDISPQLFVVEKQFDFFFKFKKYEWLKTDVQCMFFLFLLMEKKVNISSDGWINFDHILCC